MKELGNIRITSDGTQEGSKVLDAATGEPLPGFITKAVIKMEGGSAGPEAVLTFHNVEVDVVAEAEEG